MSDNLVFVLASWQIQDNEPKDMICRKQTAEKYKKHLEKFAGDKLLYFEIEVL